LRAAAPDPSAAQSFVPRSPVPIARLRPAAASRPSEEADLRRGIMAAGVTAPGAPEPRLKAGSTAGDARLTPPQERRDGHDSARLAPAAVEVRPSRLPAAGRVALPALPAIPAAVKLLLLAGWAAGTVWSLIGLLSSAIALRRMVR